MLGSIPLEFLVSFVARNRRSAPGQALLGDIHMVALHPLWPVATVTAVDKSGTFKEKGGAGHNRSFLQEQGWRDKSSKTGEVDVEYPLRHMIQNHTRSRAAARMEASGMVPGSQQFRRNWKRFMPCRMAPRFTTFLFFIASWLAAKRSWKPCGPWGEREGRRREKEHNRRRRRIFGCNISQSQGWNRFYFFQISHD